MNRNSHWIEVREQIDNIFDNHNFDPFGTASTVERDLITDALYNKEIYLGVGHDVNFDAVADALILYIMDHTPGIKL